MLFANLFLFKTMFSYYSTLILNQLIEWEIVTVFFCVHTHRPFLLQNTITKFQDQAGSELALYK